MDTMKRYLKKQLMVLSPEDAVEPLEIQSVLGPQNHHEEAIIHIAWCPPEGAVASGLMDNQEIYEIPPIKVPGTCALA